MPEVKAEKARRGYDTSSPSPSSSPPQTVSFRNKRTPRTRNSNERTSKSTRKKKKGGVEGGEEGESDDLDRGDEGGGKGTERNRGGGILELLESSMKDLRAARDLKDDDAVAKKEEEGGGEEEELNFPFPSVMSTPASVGGGDIIESLSSGREEKDRSSRRSRKSKRRKSGNGGGASDVELRRKHGLRGGGSSGKGGGGGCLPKEVRRTLECARGGVTLPREAIVSAVVRMLFDGDDTSSEGDGADDVENDRGGGGGGVAVIVVGGGGGESVGEGNGAGGGEGKTTIAALACARGDVRARYRDGIAWLGMGDDDNRRIRRHRHSPPSLDDLDYETYTGALSDICRQIGIEPRSLNLSPAVREPGEDDGVARSRMARHMIEARSRMGELLTSMTVERRRGMDDELTTTTSMLVVLDDVRVASDIEWFRFRWRGDDGSDQINDLLVTTRSSCVITGDGLTVAVPPLDTKEAIRLLLTESDLSVNHALAKSEAVTALVNACSLHPITIKFAGRWLCLKRVTSAGRKGFEEILGEISDVIIGGACDNGSQNEDVLFKLMDQATSPQIGGNKTKIVRLCFAALVTVFYKESLTSVSKEIVNDFFLELIENEREIFSKDDRFYQSNGRQTPVLVFEILGALGILNITKHAKVEGSTKNEITIRIDHDLIRQFSKYILNDGSMHHLVRKDAERCWNEAYVKSNTQQMSKYLWDDIRPDRSRKYALEKMPEHMMRASMFVEAEALLQQESFIRGRFWSLGWTEGTRAHVIDAEAFANGLRRELNDDPGCLQKLVLVFKKLEMVLMDEVSRKYGGPNGGCGTLEAGRCLHEITLSLTRFKLWGEASIFCDSCVQLVRSNLGSSELVASLLYNCSIIYMESNEFDEAEKKIRDCLEMRLSTCGIENILYVRAMCQLGYVLSTRSDYSAAESCFNKSISILKAMPPLYNIDFGIILYKLGRNQHRRGGCMDEALHCYEEALDFERNELGRNHLYISSILMHMGDLMFDKGDTQQAKYTFKEALEILNAANDNTASCDLAIAEGKLLSIDGQHENSIYKYQHALTLLRKHNPCKKRKIARIIFFVGAEYERRGNYHAAEKSYEECLKISKLVFKPFHLDIAMTLTTLSRVKILLAEADSSEPIPNKYHIQATDCLEEAIDIQKSRLGNCKDVVVTLGILGSHLKRIRSYEKSEAAYNDALQILQALEVDQTQLLAETFFGMADLMMAISKFDDAVEFYRQCLEIQEKILGKHHDDIASTLYAMGLSVQEKGANSDALACFSKSLDMLIHLHGRNHPGVGDIYDVMGFLHTKSGELDAALNRLTDSLEVRKLVGDKLMEADTLVNIGNLHRERKEYQRAIQQYDESLKIRISALGRNHESVADVLMELGNVHSDMSNTQDALARYREAVEILISVNGPTDARVASTFQKVGMVQLRAGNVESGRLFLEHSVEIFRQGVIGSDV
ncbi:hypothetical protein ACHAXA_006550 [Cyclostephanos tholiformis]|uniref:Nephrocystin-3 n=1 Tax=Cyclostephanos tholiformis TaxID=382380 RepID=A0ABD3RDN1_9STRA